MKAQAKQLESLLECQEQKAGLERPENEPCPQE